MDSERDDYTDCHKRERLRRKSKKDRDRSEHRSNRSNKYSEQNEDRRSRSRKRRQRHRKRRRHSIGRRQHQRGRSESRDRRGRSGSVNGHSCGRRKRSRSVTVQSRDRRERSGTVTGQNCDRRERSSSATGQSRRRQSRIVSDSSPPHRSRPSNSFDYPFNHNSDVRLFLCELAKTIADSRSEGNKFPLLGNVVPEFDPMVKSQTIHTWLSKVEECARLYKWDSSQTIHYAIPKLMGISKSWYDSLPSMDFTWSEWKHKLIESFPSSDDYAELLMEMLSKKVKFNQPLELYYYEKINLLNRCKIYGKNAVDCLLYGLEDRSLRLGAKAAKCQEPQQVLDYFQSIKQQFCEVDRFKFLQERKAMHMGNNNLNLIGEINDMRIL